MRRYILNNILAAILLIIVFSAALPAQQLPGMSPQAYSRLRGHTFNVKDYGAIGDSTTNDSAAFVNAVAAMSTGDALFIPTGVYNVPVDSLVLPDGSYIIGNGMRSQILLNNGAYIRIGNRGTWDNFYIAPYDTSGVVYDTLGDLGVYLWAGTNSGARVDHQISRIYGRFAHVYVNQVTDVTIRDCNIRGSDYQASGGTIALTSCHNVEVLNNILFYAGKDEIYILSPGYNTLIEGNELSGRPYNALDSAAHSGILVTTANPDPPVLGYRMMIRNNIIHDHGRHNGIDINMAGAGKHDYNEFLGITIDGNEIYSNNSPGIYVANSGITITNNDIHDNNQEGIRFADALGMGNTYTSRNVITNNRLWDNALTNDGNDGNMRFDALANSQIEGNFMWFSDSTVSTKEGQIIFLDSLYGNRICNNYMYGYDTSTAFGSASDGQDMFVGVTVGADGHTDPEDSNMIFLNHGRYWNRDSLYFNMPLVFPNASAGGATDADSIKGVPVQDTAGNLDDGYGMFYDLSSETWKYEAPPGAGSGDDAKVDTIGDGTGVHNLSATFVIQEGTNTRFHVDDVAIDTVTIDVDSVMFADSAGVADSVVLGVYLHLTPAVSDSLKGNLNLSGHNISNGGYLYALDLLADTGDSLRIRTTDADKSISVFWGSSSALRFYDGTTLKWTFTEDSLTGESGTVISGCSWHGTDLDSTQIGTAAIGSDELASTDVTPGTYTLPQMNVDADGRITAIANVNDITVCTETEAGDTANTLRGEMGDTAAAHVSGTKDSLGIDSLGNGTVQTWMSAGGGRMAVVKAGANIVLSVSDTVLTISGPSASGTADSTGIDTTGDATPEFYVYNSNAGAMVFTEGQNIQLRPYNSGGRDTIVIVGDDTVGFASDADPSGTLLAAAFQPLEATLTDIADGTISENLDNTAYPWTDNEIADNHTHTDGTIDSADFNQTQTDRYVRLLITDTAAALRSDLSDTAQGAVSDSILFHRVTDTFYKWVPLAGDTALRIYRDSANDTTTFEAVGVLKLKGTSTDPLAFGKITIDSAGVDTLTASRAYFDSVNIVGNLVTTGLIDTVDLANLAKEVEDLTDDSASWNDHVADNTQAHSDYLLNSGSDTFTGNLSGDGIDIDSASIDTLWASRANFDSATVVGTITATTFSGDLTGDVTGTADSAAAAAKVSGSATAYASFDDDTLDLATTEGATEFYHDGSGRLVIDNANGVYINGGSGPIVGDLDADSVNTEHLVVGTQVNIADGLVQDSSLASTFLKVGDSIAHAGYADSAGVVSTAGINWDYEWIHCQAVAGYVAALEDSIYLYDHVQLVGGDTIVLVVDSAGNITPDDRDTFNLVFYIPYDCTIDSLAYLFMNTGDSGVVAVDFRGPQLTAGLNLCDSSYWTDGTNRTSASWAIAGQTFADDVVASAGDRYVLQIESHFHADNNRLRIGWAKMRVKR